ncbi:DEAD/DEAH box helicase, partial [Balneolaceae bacterium ANBcel3]|nr:DEAD/DEAH box helicase [Balneolaceae bacterium ANBcel3]
MIPLQQAQELQAAISEYLKATFTFREQEVHEAFHNFVNHPKEGIFRGPYISVQLPFKTANEEEEIPLEIQPGFTPFLHQSTAFHRLSSENGDPKPTLLTTGTGSGKTESFLYPILDYCYKNRDRKGIKAIILYPMNALATDQAQRLAEMIWSDGRLKGSITAGLFIGTGSGDKKYHSDMGENHIIEDRDRIIDTKPDILLTNFKMLDYGLMRNRYHKLWSENFKDASLLKFLVLDELHTYDGAQGTDVANLIRRLKLKLNIKRGGLCPVGTSATIGEDDDSAVLLTDYAEKIFGETFSPDSVITEERLPWHQFLKEESEIKKPIPNLDRLEESRLKEIDDYGRYIDKQKRLWGFNPDASPFEVGRELKKLQIFHDLLEASTEGLCSVTQLVDKIASRSIRFKDLSEWDYRYGMSPRHIVLESLLALIAFAKSDPGGKWPFLLLRVQIWIRELSGIMRLIEAEPEFTWRDAKDPEKESIQALPMYFCRECGASGWLTKKRDDQNKFESNPGDIFQDYFSNHKNIFFVNTDTDDHQPVEEYEASTAHKTFITKESLEFSNQDNEKNLKVLALRKLNENGKSEHLCPECGTVNTVSIVGARTATLSSVAVSQTLSSNLDGREDGYRKLLAFTNSVQDAAHNAGFIEARNYRFMFRTSLQQVLNELDEGTNLNELAEQFKTYWKKRGEDNDTYYYRFYPDDCAKKARIDAYEHPNGNTFTDAFKKEFDLRIDWEIFAEYGFNSLIGRTLEKTDSSTVWVPDELFIDLHQALKPWMDENLMESVTEEDLSLFISGIIYRLRTRGGIDHPFLKKFREDEVSVWNLNWLRDNRHFLNKTYHEKKSRFPKIVTTKPHRAGIMDTTHTKFQNWFHSYFKKSFPLVPDNKDVINEFYVELFEAVTEAGIFNKKHTSKEVSFALEPGIFQVSKELKLRECGQCGHKITTAELDPYLGYSKCQQYRCTGSYSKEVKQEYDYYNKVFNRDYSPRVISREHTGILHREDRERVEESFQSYQADRSVNTLVATSTLEMGIDIGQLESSFNMGMPPLPSNYLQRIGRAGRKSGSSLISNFISQKNPHDLYYFEKPEEMMDGEIHTPGCFLNAPEILKRQFLAHCIDRWVGVNPEENTIPSQIRFIKLLTSDLRDSDFFLNRLLTYIQDHLDDIINNVRQVYEPELENEQLLRLRENIESGGFTDWVFTPFYSLKNRFSEIQEQRKEIDQYIRESNLSKEDEERIILENNKKSLYRTRRALEQQQVVEFMTLSGLLPNYAFPDKGVEFSARIFQPAAKGSDSKPENISREYVRSSSQAIRELAPHNYFFAEGYKFNIQGLMTHEWGGQKSTLELFRFCSNCDYLT